jgi:hypothetical protein
VTFYSVVQPAPSNVVVVGTVEPDPLSDYFMGDAWGIVYRWNGQHWTKRILNGTASYAYYNSVATLANQIWIVDNTADPFIPQPGTQLLRLATPPCMPASS